MNTSSGPWDVFLSYSGKQKYFAVALYDSLRRTFNGTVFLDPIFPSGGQNFPSVLFAAAQTCRLAVLLIDAQYVESRWCMLELCALLSVDTQPKILPVFLELSVADLKQKQRWHEAWEEIESHFAIDAPEWDRALAKLASHNGLVIGQFEEEHTYILRICSIIRASLAPTLRHDYSGLVGIHRLSMVVLDKIEEIQNANKPSSVCELNLYGLAGSGKSTLCRYLCDYLSPPFCGKAFHLQLPIDATREGVLEKLEGLVSDQNDKLNLSNASDIDQSLKRPDFLKSRVFLVLDNISSHLAASVLAFLRSSLAAGSVILLVARHFDVLHPPPYDTASKRKGCYVFNSMCVPSLSEGEALQVLLQNEVDLPDAYDPGVSLTPRQLFTLLNVVRMSGNGMQGQYLPLVLKIMKDQLREHGLEKWEREMIQVWKESWLCIDKALMTLVAKSYNALLRKHQIMFLDLALFILPLSYVDGESHRLEEVCVHLGLLHGCSPTEMEPELRELQRRCFLSIVENYHGQSLVIVNDVYLEFAASIEEASMYYGHRGRKGEWTSGTEMACTNRELRVALLELDGKDNYFVFSAQFSHVIAVVLMNCKSLKTLRGLEILECLASLEIHNCPHLKRVESLDTSGLGQGGLQRLKWINKYSHQQGSYEEDMFDAPSLPRPVGGLILQMRLLQVLVLENTGIRQLMNFSEFWPLLRVLEIRERHIERIYVSNYPRLERFLLFGDGMLSSSEIMFDREIEFMKDDEDDYEKRSPLHEFGPLGEFEISDDDHDGVDDNETQSSSMPGSGVCILNKGSLAGCPLLQDVYVHCVLKEEDEGLQGSRSNAIASPCLKSLRVNRFWNLTGLTDLPASVNSLEQLLIRKSPGLRSLNFHCVYPKLKKVCLESCVNLTEVTGLDRLTSLRKLEISKCASLKIVGGLAGLASLVKFDVGRACPNLKEALTLGLENLTKLTSITYYTFSPLKSQFNVRNLVNLQNLHLDANIDSSLSAGLLTGIESLVSLLMLTLKGNTKSEEDSKSSSSSTDATLDLAVLLGVAVMPSQLLNLRSLTELHLEGLRVLTSLNGIEFLDSLTELWLYNLQNLSCLSALECLTELRYLTVWECPSLEELPLLKWLPKLQALRCWDCVKLRSVGGGSGFRQLHEAHFKGCKSLAHFPLDFEILKQNRSSYGVGDFELQIEGSKFASVEALVMWVGNVKEVPLPLRRASMLALRWEFFDNLQGKEEERREMVLVLLDSVVKYALKNHPQLAVANNDNVEFSGELLLSSTWIQDVEAGSLGVCSFLDGLLEDEDFEGVRKFNSVECLEEGLRRLTRVPTEHLVPQCRTDLYFQQLVFLLFESLYNSILQVMKSDHDDY